MAEAVQLLIFLRERCNVAMAANDHFGLIFVNGKMGGTPPADDLAREPELPSCDNTAAKTLPVRIETEDCCANVMTATSNNTSHQRWRFELVNN